MSDTFVLSRTATFVAYAEPAPDSTSAAGSTHTPTEFLLRLGGTWGHEEARHGRKPYRTFEWCRACLLADTPAWVLVLGWQDFDEEAAVELLTTPEETPWLFMVEVWDTDPSVADYDARGSRLHQFQTRELSLVARIVDTIIAHETVGE